MNSGRQRRRARSEINVRQQRVCTCPRPQVNTQHQRCIPNNPPPQVQVQNPNIIMEEAHDNDEIIEDVPLTPDEVELMYNIQYRTIEWVNSVIRHGYRRRDTESIEYERAMLHYDRNRRYQGMQALAYVAAPVRRYYPNTNRNHDQTVRNDQNSHVIASGNKIEKTAVEGSGGFHNTTTSGSSQNPNPGKTIQHCASKVEEDHSGSTAVVPGSADNGKCVDSVGIKPAECTKTTTGGMKDKKLTTKEFKQSTEGGEQMTSSNKILQAAKANSGTKGSVRNDNKHAAPVVCENGNKTVIQSPSYEGILTRKRLRDQVEQAATQVKKKVRADKEKNENGGRMLLRSGVQNMNVVEPDVEQSVSGVQTRSRKNSSTSFGKKKCD